MIFAISMDYTVFLLSCAKEHWDRTHDPKEAMVGGLAHSGRVIFAAAAVMVAVFFTFALSGPLPPKEMGVILGVAVLLDAFLVRLLLLPVLLRLLGRWAWWVPKPLRADPPRHPLRSRLMSFTATARRAGGLSHEVDVNGRHTIVTDEPESIGGTDLGPAPHELLPAALASCVSTMLALYAERKGWDLGELVVGGRLRQRGRSAALRRHGPRRRTALTAEQLPASSASRARARFAARSRARSYLRSASALPQPSRAEAAQPVFRSASGGNLGVGLVAADALPDRDEQALELVAVGRLEVGEQLLLDPVHRRADLLDHREALLRDLDPVAAAVLRIAASRSRSPSPRAR